MCQEAKEKNEKEKEKKKLNELIEKNSGDRKFLKMGSRDFANTTLAERRCYIFVEIKKNEDDPNAEEEVKPISINGAAIRTPAEDIKWEEE